MARRLKVLVALWVFCVLAAGAQSAPEPAQAKAMMALVESDPELANHFGLFTTRPVTIADYGGKLVAAANVITALIGKRTTPDILNELASKEKLYSENAYGASVALDGKAFAKLLTLASAGRYSVSLEARVAGSVPNEEAQMAEASPDLFVILVYLDHTAMIEKSIAWSPEGSMVSVNVVNPLAAAGGPVPYKSMSQYDPTAFDSWEFYRFRKSIK
jgi:hypothetical protein